jgi:hypothetical protein
MSSKSITITFAIYMLLALDIHAQRRGYQEGYIINLNSDTIFGLIKDRDPEPYEGLYNKIRFKPENSRANRKYDAGDILGYGYGNNHFHSLPFREDPSFFRFDYYSGPSDPMEFLKVILVSEKLIYYEKEFEFDDNSYIDSFPLFYRPSTREFVRVTQGILGLKKKHLNRFFSDCPQLIEAINDERFQSNDVVGLFEFYMQKCQ